MYINLTNFYEHFAGKNGQKQFICNVMWLFSVGHFAKHQHHEKFDLVQCSSNLSTVFLILQYFNDRILQLDVEIRDGYCCVSIIRFVQVTLHVPCDIINAGYLDDEASCFQVTPEQAVGRRSRFEGHDEAEGHRCIVKDII